MEQRAITQMEKSQKMTKAEEKYRQAQAVYAKAVKDESERVRKIQNRHKYMMGGCVLKYFPDGFNAYDFDEEEMMKFAELQDAVMNMADETAEKSFEKAKEREKERTVIDFDAIMKKA